MNYHIVLKLEMSYVIGLFGLNCNSKNKWISSFYCFCCHNERKTLKHFQFFQYWSRDHLDASVRGGSKIDVRPKTTNIHWEL